MLIKELHVYRGNGRASQGSFGVIHEHLDLSYTCHVEDP